MSNQRRRLDLIENLINKFELNFQVQRAWISNKIDLLLSKDYENVDLCELKKLQRAQETFTSNIGSHKSRTDKIIGIAQELRCL